MADPGEEQRDEAGRADGHPGTEADERDEEDEDPRRAPAQLRAVPAQRAWDPPRCGGSGRARPGDLEALALPRARHPPEEDRRGDAEGDEVDHAVHVGEAEGQRGRRGPEAISDVAARRKVGHAGRPALAGGEPGEPIALGVEGGHTQPGDENPRDHSRVVWREHGHRHPEAGQQRAEGHQPVQPEPVAEESERRLDDRGADVGHQNDKPHPGVREVELRLEHREECRNRALGKVGG